VCSLIPERQELVKPRSDSLSSDSSTGRFNKLSEQNIDFARFIQDVRIDFESKKIHLSEFDEALKDIRIYIHDKLKVPQLD
jgi:hypothetical protein